MRCTLRVVTERELDEQRNLNFFYFVADPDAPEACLSG